MIKHLFILVILICCVFSEDSSTICTQDYCDNYPGENDPPCPTSSKLCNETDSNSGIVLLSPTPCNCCEFCIGYLKEGDSCSTGEKTSDSPTEICGPGLYCDEITEKCRTMVETPCTQKRAEYDENKAKGNIGDFQFRPQCDGDGDYLPYQCTPGGICYCVDKNGGRIFGAIENNGNAEFDLPCSCSRNRQELGIVIGRDLQPGEFFRCSQNGAYETLQCIDQTTCLCVDTIDGTPTLEDMAPVEIWAISESTLPCFDSTIHIKGKYYRRCEEIYLNKTMEFDKIKEKSDVVLSLDLPSCTPDGNYSPVQEDNQRKYCSTPDGLPIDGFILEKTQENENLLNSMNCKCAMALTLVTSVEKPSCSENGNYNPTQCRRGECFTVDEDGNQII